MKIMPVTDQSSVNAITELQEKELRKLLVYLNSNSPFYKSLFSKSDIDINNIKTINDLTKIPVTTKNDLQTHNWSFLCVPKNRIIEYCTTSGTLGTPVTIALTEKDMDRLGYNEYLSFTCAESSADDLFQ